MEGDDYAQASPRPDPDPDRTATISPAARPHGRSEPAFPVAARDHYEPLRFLGEGGMGKVFLARDVRLRRQVAIKFVHGADPQLTARLIREARAQARVRHERVCKVYEVGEIEGLVYIAMEYIAGQPLNAAARELTTEQKAMVVRDAAEGVHEAHRAGIIHRDIKPANIMVERAEDGRIRTYVMDFGVAREWTEGALTKGATMTGAIIGTPHYMAPEQARGEVGRLDRRADVYSLGATLYAIVTGEPPISGINGLEVLNNIATVEPRPPRAIDPDIPLDLEAITLKCLEKDRSARYDSARALAEDLERFLAGEPIRARPTGLWYRLRKRLRKHRRIVAIVAAALALALLALGWGLKTRAEAAARERLARRFTDLAAQIEAMERYSALAPLHDIRRDHEAMRARMGELDAEIQAAGPIAAGPGNYALGRGYLALDDDAHARSALEIAWQSGFHDPRAAYALAVVMGHIYQQQLLEAERIRNDEQREAKKREIEQRYRAPALDYLRQSEGADVPSKEYVAALIAFYEGRLDDALGQLDAIGGDLPWFYEAPELRGNILLARATKERQRGDRDPALADFEAGREAYAMAGKIGESVPAVWQALGALEYQAMLMELYGQGDVEPPFSRGVAATSRALAAMSDHYESLVLRARFHRVFAEHRGNQGGKVDDLLKSAIDDAEKAIAASPEKPLARMELGRAYRQWGEYRQGRNEDPGDQLRKAIEIFEDIRAEARDYEYYVHVGLAFKVWADYQDAAGLGSEANRGKAIEAYSRAIELNSKAVDVLINLGANYYMRASQPLSRDPDADLARSIEALDRALAINPGHIVAHFYEGEAHQLMGLQKRAHGADAGPELTRAIECYRRGLAINAKAAYLHNGVGLVLMDMAREAWDRGKAPDPILEQAQAAFDQAIAAAPELGFAYSNAGEGLLWRATYEWESGEDPTETARAAAAAFAEGLKRLPNHPTFWMNVARAQSLVGEYALEQRRDPAPAIAEAESAARKALTLNPKEVLAHLYLGHTLGLRARLRAEQGHATAEDFDAAARAFRKGLKLAPKEQDGRVLFARFCYAWASWLKSAGRDAAPALTEGLGAVEAVLSPRPSWPDALVTRSGLLLLKSRISADPAEQQAQAARAAEDLKAALAANPRLEERWKP